MNSKEIGYENMD